MRQLTIRASDFKQADSTIENCPLARAAKRFFNTTSATEHTHYVIIDDVTYYHEEYSVLERHDWAIAKLLFFLPIPIRFITLYDDITKMPGYYQALNPEKFKPEITMTMRHIYVGAGFIIAFALGMLVGRIFGHPTYIYPEPVNWQSEFMFKTQYDSLVLYMMREEDRETTHECAKEILNDSTVTVTDKLLPEIWYNSN